MGRAQLLREALARVNGVRPLRRGGKPVLIPVAHVYYRMVGGARKGVVGETDHSKRTIWIAASSVSNWCQTFWHEFWHGALHQLGYISDGEDEAKVEAFAHVMMRLVTDRHGRKLLRQMLDGLPELKD